jgi:hypothetical protein
MRAHLMKHHLFHDVGALSGGQCVLRGFFVKIAVNRG